MLLALVVAVFLQVPFAQQVQEAYAQEEADSLEALLSSAESQEDSLLVRYRLYPLTEDEAVLDPIPRTLSEEASARACALLSGLWSYRAGETNIFRAIDYGRHATDLLEKAKEQDPTDPYVLLIEGQSLLFRPSIAGRDPAAAARQFSTLVEQTEEEENPVGLPRIEAHIWLWMALREADRAKQATALHQRLTSQALPPLYRQFLRDPPEV